MRYTKGVQSPAQEANVAHGQALIGLGFFIRMYDRGPTGHVVIFPFT